MGKGMGTLMVDPYPYLGDTPTQNPAGLPLPLQYPSCGNHGYFRFQPVLHKVGHKQTAVLARLQFQLAQSCNNSFKTQKLQIQRKMYTIRLKTT